MKHKYSLIALMFLLSGSFTETLPQTYNGAIFEFYLGRQPSARAEAMGRGMSAVTGDALSYYFNPAGTASLKGLNVNASFAGPFYLLDKGSYNFIGASYKIEEYGNVGFNRDYFTYGEEVVITNEFGDQTGSYTPHLSNYRLNLSSEVMENFFVGANLNLLQPRYTSGVLTVGNERGSEQKDVFYFDLGVIKSFGIKKKSMDHKFNIATSMMNVNFAEYAAADSDQGDPLPVILRIGAAYDLSIDDKSISPKLKSYNFLVNAEYEDLLNSKYYSAIRGGLEFTFLEILSLRGGYYTQDLNDHGSVNNKDKVSEFTYGIGVNIPVRQLTDSRTPLEVKFDFTTLKQPSFTNMKDDW